MRKFLNVTMILLWLIMGIGVFTSGEVSMLQYACIWLVLISSLLEKLIREW